MLPHLIFTFLLPSVVFSLTFSSSRNSLTYEDIRNSVIDAEEKILTGGNVHLSAKENAVNKILMKNKYDELTHGFKYNEYLIPALHFFKAKKLMEESPIFKFIRHMPKGAVLHAHNTAQVSSEWVIRNLTYMPGIMKCEDTKGVPILTFRKSAEHKCKDDYVRLTTERRQFGDARAYDAELEKLINLYTPHPETEYPYLSTVWNKFQSIFTTTSDAFSYLPAFKAYHWRLFEELYQDNVMYIELRMSFKTLYDAEGKTYDSIATIKILKNILDEFVSKHPGFLGAKVIYSTSRNTEMTKVSERMELFKTYYSMFPDFVIGFDLVGQEDLGKPLYNFVDALKQMPKGAKFFFHAGETNWYGASTDFNLLDAILLNTTRIGHGYALNKHPVLWNAVKSRDIAVEISPISNQVLNLCGDLRNHPASFLMSENIPIVISNDDPGYWNAKGLSYDMYYAFMSFAPSNVGLPILKKLVWNSIKYSSLTDAERRWAYSMLQKQWEKFLNRVIAGYIEETESDEVNSKLTPPVNVPTPVEVAVSA